MADLKKNSDKNAFRELLEEIERRHKLFNENKKSNETINNTDGKPPSSDEAYKTELDTEREEIDETITTHITLKPEEEAESERVKDENPDIIEPKPEIIEPEAEIKLIDVQELSESKTEAGNQSESLNSYQEEVIEPYIT